MKKTKYSEEEKRKILEKLDEERHLNQKALDKANRKSQNKYDELEKKRILDKLNKERLTKQRREEISKNRINNKELYTFRDKKFYKFENMRREYYISVDDCNIISPRPIKIFLYYKTFGEFKKEEVLIKTEVFSDKFFISYNPVRVYFKEYSLENARL